MIVFYEKSEMSEWMSEKVSKMKDIAEIQRHVLGLGDRMHATTITANARSIQKLLHVGINLDVFIHRAIWLTGL